MQLHCKRKIYKEKYRMFARDSQMLRNKRHFVISVIAINVFYCISIIIQRFHSVRDRCWHDVSAWRGSVAQNVWNKNIKAPLSLSYDPFENLDAMGYKFNHFWT